MSTLLQFGGSMRTVQRGQTTSNTSTSALDVTITAVSSLTKAFVVQASGHGVNGGGVHTQAYGYLTSTTNLRIINSRGDGTGNAPILAWEVVEFY